MRDIVLPVSGIRVRVVSTFLAALTVFAAFTSLSTFAILTVLALCSAFARLAVSFTSVAFFLILANGFATLVMLRLGVTSN